MTPAELEAIGRRARHTAVYVDTLDALKDDSCAFRVVFRDVPELVAEVGRLGADLKKARGQLDELSGALRSVIAEARFVLRGGDDTPDVCGECGLAGVGMLRDAITGAHRVLGEP